MTLVAGTPTNTNSLLQSNFVFRIRKAPHVNFFIQSAEVPQITIPSTQHPTPFVARKIPGDHITFDPFNISFLVDEDLQGYLEIHNWLMGIGFPNEFDEYADLASQPSVLGLGIYSDISLTVLTSAKNPNFEIIFKDAFPISLSTLNMEATVDAGGVSYQTVHAAFDYTSYSIQRIV